MAGAFILRRIEDVGKSMASNEIGFRLPEAFPAAMMAFMKRRAKAVTFVVVLLGVAVIAAALGSWKEFLARYHLHRLRQDGGYLTGIVGRPEGTPERMAIRAFLKSDAGAAALLSAFLSEIEKESPRLAGFDGATSFLIGLITDGGSGRTFLWSVRKTRNVSLGSNSGIEQSGNLLAIDGLLEAVAGRELALPGEPSYVIAAVPAEEAYETHFPRRPVRISRLIQREGPPAGAHPFACLVRRKDLRASE